MGCAVGRVCGGSVIRFPFREVGWEPGHGRPAVPGVRGCAGWPGDGRVMRGSGQKRLVTVRPGGVGSATRGLTGAPVTGLAVTGELCRLGVFEGGDGGVGDGVDGLHRVGDQQGGGVGEGVPGQVGGA